MAIALDATSSVADASAASITLAHTVTGTNPILFVSILHHAGSGFIQTVTYNGVSMALVGGEQTVTGSAYGLSLWCLAGPATGTNNIVIETSNNGIADVIGISYTGAYQSTQPEQNSSSSGAGTQVASLTTTFDNDWAVICYAGCNASTNITERITVGSLKVGDSNGVIHPAGSYSQTTTVGGPGGAINAAFMPYSVRTAVSDSVTTSETISGVRAAKATVADTVTTSDTNAVQKGKVIGVSDSVTTAETSAANFKWSRQSKDTTVWTDQTEH